MFKKIGLIMGLMISAASAHPAMTSISVDHNVVMTLPWGSKLSGGCVLRKTGPKHFLINRCVITTP